MTVRGPWPWVEPRALIEMSPEAFVRAHLTSDPWHEEAADAVEYDDIIA